MRHAGLMNNKHLEFYLRKNDRVVKLNLNIFEILITLTIAHIIFMVLQSHKLIET